MWITELPVDVCASILQFLPPSEIVRARRTNKFFFEACSDMLLWNNVWKANFASEAPEDPLQAFLNLSIWGTRKIVECASLSLHPSGAARAYFITEGNHILSSGKDGNVKVSEISRWEEKSSLINISEAKLHTRDIYTMRINPAFPHRFITTGEESFVGYGEFDPESYKIKGQMFGGGGQTGMALCWVSGDVFAMGNWGKLVQVYRTAPVVNDKYADAVTLLWKLDVGIEQYEFSSVFGGNRLLGTSTNSHRASYVDVEAQAHEMVEFAPGGGAIGVCMRTPNEAVLGSTSGQLIELDLRMRAAVSCHKYGASDPWVLDVHCMEYLSACSDASGVITVFDHRKQEAVWSHGFTTGSAVRGFDIDWHRGRIAAASWDCHVRCYGPGPVSG